MSAYIRRWLFAAGIAGLAVVHSDNSFAQVRAKFVFEGLANCQQPALSNYPIRVEGTGTLSRDRSANLDVNSNIEGQQSYRPTLGGRPVETAAGSASLRVLGRSTLRATRDYPNNVLYIDITVTGDRCSVKVDNRLKPGKRQYTFQTSVGLAYCSKPQVVSTSCTPM